MDPCAMAWFELKFEIAWRRVRGEAFQYLFSSIMDTRHPGGFQRVRPGGRAGVENLAKMAPTRWHRDKKRPCVCSSICTPI